MAEYSMILKTGSELVLNTDASRVNSLTVNVQLNNVAITDLVKSNFTLTTGSGAIDAANFDINTADATNGNYTINFTGADNTKPASNSFIVVVATSTDSADSGKLFVDPLSTFTNGYGTVDYPTDQITVPGQYTFKVGQVGQDAPIDVTSQTYSFINAPTTGNSSISVKGYNPIQSIIISPSETSIPLELYLADANGPIGTGNTSATIFSTRI